MTVSSLSLVEKGDDARSHLAPPPTQRRRRVSIEPDEEVKIRSNSIIKEKKEDKVETSLVCSPETLKRKLPVLDWLPNYKREYLVPDIIAGFSVGLTVIPHAIAFANLARVPVEIGLYSSFVGCFVYLLLGSVTQVTIGPTATASLMTAAFVAIPGYPYEYAISLCFVSGCVTLLAGIFNLGFLLNFISAPVSSAFTSAVAINIASTQIKSILGLKFKANGFIDVWRKIFTNLHNTGSSEPILGLACIAFLVSLRYLKTYEWGERDERLQSPREKILKKIIWFCCTASNALVVILSILVAFIMDKSGVPDAFPLTGEIKAGLPSVALPPLFTGIERTVGNTTVVDGFGDVVSNLSSGYIVIPILAVLEQISIAKAFANGRAIDSNQEMISIGVSNILGSFVGSMPVTGAFARVAINAASGVKTQAGGILTGFIVLLAISFLGPILYYIPIPTLGAVVICAVIFVVDPTEVQRLWKTKRIDLIPYFATFFGALLWSLQSGILLGVVLNILIILQDAASPKITSYITQVNEEEVLVVRPDRSLFYPGMERVKQKINAMAQDDAMTGHNRTVIVDCSAIANADSTTCKVLATLLQDFENRGQGILFMGLNPRPLTVLEGMMNPKFLHIPSSTNLASTSQLEKSHPELTSHI